MRVIKLHKLVNTVSNLTVFAFLFAVIFTQINGIVAFILLIIAMSGVVFIFSHSNYILTVAESLKWYSSIAGVDIILKCLNVCDEYLTHNKSGVNTMVDEAINNIYTSSFDIFLILNDSRLKHDEKHENDDINCYISARICEIAKSGEFVSQFLSVESNIGSLGNNSSI